MALEVWDCRRDVRNLFITPEIRARIMRFDPHQLSAGHAHDLGHEMFLVLDGQAEFTIDGQSAVLLPGQACVARAGQWHEVRAVGDAPMTLYLSVTPHIEPTHTQWDREGGARLPYRYGASTRTERAAAAAPGALPALIEQHLAASERLAEAARANADAQAMAAAELRAALAAEDTRGAARAAVDAMWAAFRSLHGQLQASQLVWNELAPAATAE